jgi:hypothetical protein
MAFDTLFSIALSTQKIHPAIFLDLAGTVAFGVRYSYRFTNCRQEAPSCFRPSERQRDAPAT